MIGRGLFENTAVSVEIAESIADDETLTGVGVDMQGYEGVTFIMIVESPGEVASYSIKAQVDTESDFSDDPQDMEGTSVSLSSHATDDKYTMLELYQPHGDDDDDRYVRAVVTVPDVTSGKALTVLAIRWGARTLPITNVGERHEHAGEGTA